MQTGETPLQMSISHWGILAFEPVWGTVLRPIYRRVSPMAIWDQPPHQPEPYPFYRSREIVGFRQVPPS